MGRKEIGHEVEILNKIRPTSCANAAAFNAAHTTTGVAVETGQSVMFVLQFADDNSTPDYVFQLYETDTSITTTGTAVAEADMIVHGHTAAGAAADGKISAGVLTMTANADEDNVYTFEYIGSKSWCRLYCPTGTKTNVIALTVVKSHSRHQPKIA